MTFDEYQTEAAKTINYSNDFNSIVCAALGLAGEAGETVDVIKKWYGQGHDLDKFKLMYEIGDVLWYLNYLCDALGVTLDEVAQTNIMKLRKRYGESFEADKSVNRKDNM